MTPEVPPRENLLLTAQSPETASFIAFNHLAFNHLAFRHTGQQRIRQVAAVALIPETRFDPISTDITLPGFDSPIRLANDCWMDGLLICISGAVRTAFRTAFGTALGTASRTAFGTASRTAWVVKTIKQGAASYGVEVAS